MKSEGSRRKAGEEEEGRTAGGSAHPKTRTPHNDVRKKVKQGTNLYRKSLSFIQPMPSHMRTAKFICGAPPLPHTPCLCELVCSCGLTDLGPKRNQVTR